MPELSTTEPCVSDLVLDEWLAAELDAAANELVAAHVAGCARCAARKRDRDRDREQFLQAAPSFRAHAALSGRTAPSARKGSRRAWLAGTASALALAASVWLLIGVRPSAEPITRSKGSAHLGFFVKHGAHVARGVSGQTVYPGDELRFTYTSPRAAHLALVNIDADAATVYFPSGSAQAAQVAAGSDVALDFSVELDGLLGTERVYAVFCPQPYALEPMRAALQASSARTLDAAMHGCELDEITLHKAAPR